MYISNIKLTNWKNFTQVDVSLTERAFLVGPNASGKSNFLDAIRFLRDIAQDGGGLQEAVERRGGISKIRCLVARKQGDIEIEIELSDSPLKLLWKYAIGLTQRGGGVVGKRAVLRFEKVWKANKLILERPNEADKNDEALDEYTYLEQPTANVSFRELADFFKQIDYQHIVPQLIRDPISFQRHSGREDFFGRDLFEKMSKMSQAKRKSQLKKIENALKYAVPNLKNLTLETDKMGIPHLQVIYEHWRPHGAKQNEEQFSDGTLRLIGLFYSMLNGQYPLLLEEPELSLHSGIVKRLAETIFKMQKRKTFKRQVILSTHSFDLLNSQGISADEVIVLSPETEGTTVKNAKDIKKIKELLDMGLTSAEAVLPHTEPMQIDKMSSHLGDI